MSIRILVVDDEQIIQEMLQDVLEDHGYNVQCASNGLEGLECIDRIKPDLLLVDVRMPEMNGIDMLKIVNESENYPPTILMSADSSENIIKSAKRMGVFAFLKKPFKMKTLLETVSAAIDMKQAI